MAQSNVVLAAPAGASEFIETALGAAVEQVKGAGGTLYAVQVDNSNNVNANVYVKAYYLATPGAVTLGTTVPDEVWFIPAGKKQPVMPMKGKAFATGMQVVCVTAGGTG